MRLRHSVAVLVADLTMARIESYQSTYSGCSDCFDPLDGHDAQMYLLSEMLMLAALTKSH